MSTHSSLPRRFAGGALAAITLAGTLAASTLSADAAPRRWHHRYHHNNGATWVAPAIIGGLLLGTLAARAHQVPPAVRCWTEPRRVVDRFGHVHFRRVQVCS